MLLQTLLYSQTNSSTAFNPAPFKPTLSSRLVNGLWFCSLFFSLVSALGASLGKSWLAEYAQIRCKSNAKDAYERHRRYIGISKWHLVDVLTFLPILLHNAFLLFACGLIILLFGDNKVIGAIILVLTTVAFALYLGTATASFVDPDCPFRTPLTKFLARIKAWLFNSKYGISQERYMSSKGEMLLWLHDYCHESADIDQIMPAIAGLNIKSQQMFHNSGLAMTMRDRLCSADFNPDFLKVYYYTIERVGLWGISSCNPIV